MNINISPRGFENIDINNMGDNALVKIAQNSDAKAAMTIIDSIQGMTPGQIIEGKILDTDGTNARLLINNNIILNSLINSDANLVNGQTFSFEVQSNNNGQPILRPLHTNMVNEATAVKALEAANVNINDKTLAMVDSLMKEGMPISKDMIQTLNKEISSYPNSPVEDIVLLHKLNIDVNNENLTQIGMYRNNNGWMIENVNSLSENIVDLIAEASMGDSSSFEGILSGLKGFFEDMINTNSQISTGTDVNAKNETGIDKNQVGNGALTPDSLESTTDSKSNTVIESLKEDSTADNSLNSLFDKISSMSPERLKQPAVKHRLLNEFSKILSDNMLMEPDKVSDKAYVKNYYERMLQISEKFSASLNELGKNESAIAKNLDGLKSNIGFINDMNEMYNYVQFPLKMADSQANGDLYVYRRKNNKSNGSSDEPLTALLHLSMETLGNMDIFLTLQNDKLSTRFELEKEEMIDFIESHIDELNKRLEKKGYTINTTVEQSQKEIHNVIDLINKEIGTVPIMSINGFDARA